MPKIVKSQQDNFLGELRGLLGSVREVVNAHWQLPPYQVPMVYQQPPQFPTNAGTNVCHSSRPRSAISEFKGKPLEAMKLRSEERIRCGGKSSCCPWHGSRGVILKNQKISINYWFLRPYAHNLVKMQILGNFK